MPRGLLRPGSTTGPRPLPGGRVRDNPWLRLPAELAIAAVVWGVVLQNLGNTLAHPPQLPPPPLDAQLVSLPPPPPPKPKVKPRPKRPPEHKPRPVKKIVLDPHHPLHLSPAATAAMIVVVVTPPPATPAPTQPPLAHAFIGAHILFQPTFVVPDSMRQEALHAVAIARFTIRRDGSAQVALRRGTPNPRLNLALETTLGLWKFFPALSGGQPVVSTMDVRIPVDIE